MRSKLLTMWAVVLMGAFGAAVQGRVALMMEELEASPFTRIYARVISPSVAPSDKAELRQEAKRLYLAGKCVGNEDLYRLASVLAQSNDPADLLLAHDCALASLIEGFRLSKKALRTSQKRLLRLIGHVAVSRESPRTNLPLAASLLERFEASWSAAAKRDPQNRTGMSSLVVVD